MLDIINASSTHVSKLFQLMNPSEVCSLTFYFGIVHRQHTKHCPSKTFLFKDILRPRVDNVC